ncbi:HNH endonuclease family protein [Nonomuraea typhae]|uniref:HNH endonuclease family protein n=1 Tax=Nonomuraea typhae TaxID=2603600 RepID=UPI001FE96A1B|nr:HNH endonuclease family protein [Nonomuraea typhae]
MPRTSTHTTPTRISLTSAIALALTLLPTALLPSAASAASPAAPAEGPLLTEAIAALPVAAERREGYQRTSFRHWIDADGDSCNTRAEVLLEEAITPPAVGASCRLTGGSWHSYYDDQQVSDAAALDVDHLVPLAEAWDSGAYTWSAEQRRDYANYLDDSWHLVAVTARSNRQKADQDPTTWLPGYEVCRYTAEWTAIKRHWNLSIDSTEKEKLTAIAADCPSQRLPTSPADPR